MEQRSMNQVTDKELQRMTAPTVAMEQHQVHLKQALLAASYPANKTAKTRWSNLMRYTKKPKFIVSGLTMAFAAVAIVAFSTFTSLGSVSAAELTQQSLDKVSQLPGALKTSRYSPTTSSRTYRLAVQTTLRCMDQTVVRLARTVLIHRVLNI
jgi:hypothetical protein